MKVKQNLLILALATATTVTLNTKVNAQSRTCSITSVTGVNFSSYNVLSNSPTDSDGSLIYRCDNNTSFRIDLSRGNASSYQPRQMRKGTEVLQYNLFRDAARTSIWGDGTSGTSNINTTATNAGNNTIPIYGRIPGGQDVSAGNYTDTITITITF